MDGYACSCDAGWDGADCKDNIDDCDGKGFLECGNGRCVDRVDGYACISNLARSKDLFILSGQSNMARLLPEISFIPALETSLGKGQFVTAKYAAGGRQILGWVKRESLDFKYNGAGNQYAGLAAAITNSLAALNVEMGGYCAEDEHVKLNACAACAAGTRNALNTESALHAELTTGEGSCSAAAGMYDLTLEQCQHALNERVDVEVLVEAKDYGTAYPHGCFNRGDIQPKGSSYHYNTGGTHGTSAGSASKPHQTPVRVCGIGGDDASGDDTACDLAITPATAGSELGTPAPSAPSAARVAASPAERMAAPRSVTLLWMQGEADTRSIKYDNVARYEERFMTLLDQLKADFGFDTINVVIGRLSDSTKYYSMTNDSQITHNWNAIRAIQERTVATLPRAALVNTDDLNAEGVIDDVHYTVEGYKTFGERLAAAALALLATSNCHSSRFTAGTSATHDDSSCAACAPGTFAASNTVACASYANTASNCHSSRLTPGTSATSDDSRCLECSSGEYASGDDTSCDVTICGDNERVEDFKCVPCGPGRHKANKDKVVKATAGTTGLCARITCDENHFVSSNVCMPCASGTTRPAGDKATSPTDTVCYVA